MAQEAAQEDGRATDFPEIATAYGPAACEDLNVEAVDRERRVERRSVDQPLVKSDTQPQIPSQSLVGLGSQSKNGSPVEGQNGSPVESVMTFATFRPLELGDSAHSVHSAQSDSAQNPFTGPIGSLKAAKLATAAVLGYLRHLHQNATDVVIITFAAVVGVVGVKERSGLKRLKGPHFVQNTKKLKKERLFGHWKKTKNRRKTDEKKISSVLIRLISINLINVYCRSDLSC